MLNDAVTTNYAGILKGGGAVMEGGDGPPCIVNLRLCSYLKLSQGVAMYFMAGPNWLLLMLLLML